MIIAINTVIRRVNKPTREGFPEVHADGSIVSRAVLKPIMMENPVTEAVIVPNVTAARAFVPMCPIDTTGAIWSEYSNTCVLYVPMIKDASQSF
jgi:hypothetical protein